MTQIIKSFRDIFKPIKSLQPGIYHFISPQDDPRNYRLHLRIEIDGSGILIINGSTILHLNQTATEYAYCLVNNYPIDKAARLISERYNINQQQAGNDYQSFIERIQILINTPDLDPVTFLDFERTPPLSGAISAPYRLDCAITYRLSDGENQGLTPIERVKSELTTEEWFTIFDKAWKVGIPHIVFTGGEPTKRDDLVQLISHLQENGQISGLITDGSKLENDQYFSQILYAGLDHLMLLYDRDKTNKIKILKKIINADLFVSIHLTLDQDNLSWILESIDQLAEIGVRSISLSAIDTGLKDKLILARQRVADRNLQLVWELPVPYSSHNPIRLETNMTPSEGAGKAWLYIEPDGDVLPAQGINKVLGNMLNDPWEKIWRH